MAAMGKSAFRRPYRLLRGTLLSSAAQRSDSDSDSLRQKAGNFHKRITSAARRH